ncbi:uncharacterized protein [Sylvia atricapilla]|uniref:uncharacterized protein n=1 Tax=Sylvia atricapilla TaxID=48155 RepID=UPI00339140D7
MVVAPRAPRAALAIYLRGHPRPVTRRDDTASSLPGSSGRRDTGQAAGGDSLGFMEQPLKPSPKQMRPPSSSDSFSSRFLGQILQLRLVEYPLKLLQKASVWVGLVFPVETLRSKLCPPAQSPTRSGKLVHLLLSVTPTRIQNFLGYLLTEWNQSDMSKEIQEALMDPARERDDAAPEQQETWLVLLEKDLPEDDSDFTYEVRCCDC